MTLLFASTSFQEHFGIRMLNQFHKQKGAPVSTLLLKGCHKKQELLYKQIHRCARDASRLRARVHPGRHSSARLEFQERVASSSNSLKFCKHSQGTASAALPGT